MVLLRLHLRLLRNGAAVGVVAPPSSWCPVVSLRLSICATPVSCWQRAALSAGRNELPLCAVQDTTTIILAAECVRVRVCGRPSAAHSCCSPAHPAFLLLLLLLLLFVTQ